MIRTYTVRLLVWLLLAFGAFIPHATVVAAGEFQADYDVAYAIAPTGKTIVTQSVTLTNKLANFYPQEYSLLIDSDKISNIIAYDDKGVITPTISVKDGKTQIALKFNVKAIGLGKTLPFSLRYEHAGIANRAGSIWEVYIPGVVNDPDIATYNVTLAAPPTFGPAAYLSPLPANGNTWNKDQMIRGGIAGAYGKSQRFSVSLSYALMNPRGSVQVQEIALPPDTAYQEATLMSLEPKPETVIRDDDGNWIARYTLASHASLSVKANMSIATFLFPRPGFIGQPVNDAAQTGAEEYWDTNDPRITALAATYTTPRAIYDYVVSALSYDYSKVNAQATRLGAVGALNTPKSAVCTEFTDLFVAIARAAGIPARRIVGYAYTNNPKLRPLSIVSDVLHAWPEYYDRQSNVWVPVDPTWASTTGGVDYFTKVDFNHLVFAINGASSSVPYPAGYYRSAGVNSRDVNVEFADKDVGTAAPNIESVIEFPERVGAGTTARGTITVTNRGSVSAYTVAVSVVSEPGNIHVERTIAELLPFASEKIAFSSQFPQSLNTMTGKITARVNDGMISKTFSIQPLYWVLALGISVFVLASVAVAWIIRFVLWKISKKR